MTNTYHIKMTMSDSTTLMTVKPRLRQQYRTQLGIAGDILQVCVGAGSKGALVSKVSRFANLSHYATLGNCQKLIDAGLIDSIKTKRNTVYKITDKGINFLYEFQRFQDLIKEVRLRY